MHISVLLKETIEALNIKEDGIYVDATLGYAGHSSEVLKGIRRGYLFAFDQDIEAINHSDKTLSLIASNYEIIKSNFSNLKFELEKRNITEIDGIIFDLGVSSPQIDEATRGFSYMKDAKLDMRMDQSSKISAYDVINTYSFEELLQIFYEYGEENYSKSIAKKIVEKRAIKKIDTTKELVDIIDSSVPTKYKINNHPVRKIFQAIRIEVNNELEVLKIALHDAIELLKPGGMICVITFHSLEDKICKEIFRSYSEVDKMYKGLPNIPLEYRPKLEIIDKISPSKEEIGHNSRSKSSKLRVAKKI